MCDVCDDHWAHAPPTRYLPTTNPQGLFYLLQNIVSRLPGGNFRQRGGLVTRNRCWKCGRLRNVSRDSGHWEAMALLDNERSPALHSELEIGMDPVSATASLAGLLAFATGLVKTTYALSTSATDFRNEWTTMANEVAQLLGVLTALKAPDGLDTAEIHPSSHIPAEPSSPSTSSLVSSSLSTPSEKEYDVLTIRRTRGYLSIQLENEITACQTTLMEVKRLLSHSQPRIGERISNIAKQLMWPLRKQEFQRLMGRLESHKSTFVLILSSQGTYAPPPITLM